MAMGGHTAKLSMIHPAPRMDRQDTMHITMLWIRFSESVVGAAKAALGEISKGRIMAVVAVVS